MGRCETREIGMTNNVDEFLDFISEFNLVEPECIHQTIRCLLDDLRSDPRRKPYVPAARSRCQIPRSNTCQPLPKRKMHCFYPEGTHPCSARPLPMVLPQTRWISAWITTGSGATGEPAYLPVMLALVETMPHQPTGHEF